MTHTERVLCASDLFTKILRGVAVLSCAPCLVACTSTHESASPRLDAGADVPSPHVFVIAMENHDAKQIYGNPTGAPYINGTLLPRYAHSSSFQDALPELPSQPHYILMEAGTNQLNDHTFVDDAAPSDANSTSSTDHLVAQIDSSPSKLTWMSYQEGIDANTGRCPIVSSGFYHPKHNPFVYFRDVSGSPPSKGDEHCAEHHRDLSALENDLGGDGVANYNFITPNQCNDMHGQKDCPEGDTIQSGDAWLEQHLPPLIQFVEANGGVIFVTWDEGVKDNLIPFIAIGPKIKEGYESTLATDHRSMVKSIELLLGLPILPAVESASTLADMFVDSAFPIIRRGPAGAVTSGDR